MTTRRGERARTKPMDESRPSSSTVMSSREPESPSDSMLSQYKLVDELNLRQFKQVGDIFKLVDRMRPLESDLYNIQEYSANVLKLRRMLRQLQLPYVENQTMRKLLMKMPVIQRQMYDLYCLAMKWEDKRSIDNFVSWVNRNLDMLSS